MDWKDLIIDGYNRIPEELGTILKGLKISELERQPCAECNSLGWTVWHLGRVQDAQIADLAGGEQVYITGKWYAKFKREADPADSGFGHTAAQVAAFKSPSADVQLEYIRATTEQTQKYLKQLSPKELDRVLNEPWFTPRPTVGVRLVSILADCHQHAGEAAYIRGLIKRLKS